MTESRYFQIQEDVVRELAFSTADLVLAIRQNRTIQPSETKRAEDALLAMRHELLENRW